MPPSSLVRPLPVDIILFLVPILIGLGAFFLGRFFNRWSIAVRAGLIGLTTGAICVVAALLFHALPRPIDVSFSFAGGVIVVLCWMILGVIGFSWATPNPAAPLFFRFMIPILPLMLIGVEAGGSLWFRFFETHVWYNLPGESGVMKQTTKVTCLPAAAVMLLHQYGIDNVSEGEFAYLANTSFFGTDGHVMARAITQKIDKPGVRAVMIDVTYEEMAEREAPFIAQVQMQKMGTHSVFVKKLTLHTLVWVDPFDGFPRDVPPATFDHVWTGSVIVIEGMDPVPAERP